MFGLVVIVGLVFLDVGTFVILYVERCSGTEIFVEVIHGIEIKSQYTERTGGQVGFIWLDNPFPFRGTV